MLPDLTAVVDEKTGEPVWAFKGEERISVASAGGDGTVLAELWEARARHGERETVYRFWASRDKSRGGGGGGDERRAAERGGGGAAPPLAVLLRPLRLHQQGPDLLSGSHFDEYVVDYGELVPGPPPASSFEKPTSCVGVDVEAVKGPTEKERKERRRRAARLAATAASLAPRLPCSESKVRVKGSLSAASRPPPPPSALEENAAFVARHNGDGGAASQLLSSSASPPSSSSSVSSSPPSSFRVELNRFAALSDAEFAATYLQSESLAARRQRRKSEEERGSGDGDDDDNDEALQSSSSSKKKKKKKHSSAELPYSRKVPKGRVPSAVEWRGTGAVSAAVKDQSTCGSCWAFGTSAAVEGAAFLSSEKSPPVSVSEQQFMDCSWDYGANSACGGGDADAALDWLVAERRGEFEVEADYQYRGAAGFCRKGVPVLEIPSPLDSSSSSSSSPSSSSSSPSTPSSPRRARVKGYAYVPRGDDEAVMEAVHSRGPLQVSIDAAARGFRFYSSGVYDEPSCSPEEEDLDHSVALVGFGTDEASGKDYWLVRNSWCVSFHFVCVSVFLAFGSLVPLPSPSSLSLLSLSLSLPLLALALALSLALSLALAFALSSRSPSPPPPQKKTHILFSLSLSVKYFQGPRIGETGDTSRSRGPTAGAASGPLPCTR